MKFRNNLYYKSYEKQKARHSNYPINCFLISASIMVNIIYTANLINLFIFLLTIRHFFKLLFLIANSLLRSLIIFTAHLYRGTLYIRSIYSTGKVSVN